ncbi:hypothetical protein DM794_07950 [Paenarthrobacter ureafaciens]|uniref:hypothetical protein n=1 Tax=Paenarthrobacter TaxID=1742992 RepID=UPI0015BFF44C|nr:MULTISPECIES: hypothetical protein [Paenarthrobacter]BCW86063.1 hypothetical protein NicSoilE8_37360 [Arthrobacter sp. NicSoilE8]MEC3852919.1 hypothetical protein [Paenarthrobacter ureafaciens]NWL26992.1 hypothetical protein [Paenarthrobacter ureafaciens]QSZ52388.1 hypothetical protein AYX19_04825 [Paenarthrobacter ureafaciens]WOC60850.1 hypothetical protein RI444_20520 [Paenarthrobacter sp. AT5]
MKHGKHQVEVTDWSVLQPGEMVAVTGDPFTQDTLCIEETAPELGVIWVRRKTSGDRKVLNAGDYRIWRLT